MDYSQYKVLEFRRKFFKFKGASISIFDPVSQALVGFVGSKGWTFRAGVGVYTDMSRQHELVHIGRRLGQGINLKPLYDVTDTATGALLSTLRFRGLKTYLARGHVDLLDSQGNQYGYVQETSSQVAIMRRWFGLLGGIGDLLELAFAFVPQTFDIVYTSPTGPQLVGKIVHRKNPIIVKMSLDTTQAQMHLDPRVSIAICTILSVLDANKNA